MNQVAFWNVVVCGTIESEWALQLRINPKYIHSLDAFKEFCDIECWTSNVSYLQHINFRLLSDDRIDRN